MKIDLSMYEVPEIVEIDGKFQIYDKLKGIYRIVSEDTQREEFVRQKTIEYLHDKLKINYEAIDIEESEAHYHDNNKRMDLLVSGMSNKKELLMVVECKAEDIPLTEDTYEQVKGYANRLNIPVVMIINGKEMDFLRRYDNEHYEQIIKPPTYNELLNYPDIETRPILEYCYKRYSYEELFDENIHRKEIFRGFNEKNKTITEDTRKELIPYILNFRDCLLDTSHKIKNLHLGKYKFIEDLGVYYRKIDNTGISNFTDNYRSLSVKIDNKIEIINLLVTTYATASKIETVLMIALNNYEIQWIRFDRFSKLENKTLKIYDNGATSTRNKGPIKRSIILDYIKENSNIPIKNNMAELGYIEMSDLIYCDNSNFENDLGNCIQYALLKQERREIYKKEYKSKRNNTNTDGPIGVQKRHINKIIKKHGFKKIDENAQDFLINYLNNWAKNISENALQISKNHKHQTIKWADMVNALIDDKNN